MKIRRVVVSIVVLVAIIMCAKFMGRQAGRRAYESEVTNNFLKPSTSTPAPSQSDQFAQCFTDEVTINEMGAITQYTSEIPGEGIYNLMISHNTGPVKTEAAIHAALNGFLEGRTRMAGDDLRIIGREIVQYGKYTAIEYEYSATQSGMQLFYKGLYFQYPGSTTQGGVAMDNGYNISTVCMSTTKDIAYKKYNSIREAFLKVEL